jgi:hypothetical protein
VKIRNLLAKLQLRPSSGEGKRSEDTVDALSASLHNVDPGAYGAAPSAPTNWVPSQQDERPRY